MADFGLSKNTYAKMYFRQDTTEVVKLPIKWLALESMEDAIFSEKTDVVSNAQREGVGVSTTPKVTNVFICFQWSFGVTCWEVFSGGKQPYPGISPLSLHWLLEEGQRLEKPNNAACSNAT